jgi:hypothetical protein
MLSPGSGLLNCQIVAWAISKLCSLRAYWILILLLPLHVAQIVPIEERLVINWFSDIRAKPKALMFLFACQNALKLVHEQW